VTEDADNGGFLSHSTGLSLDNSLPSFQEYAPIWLLQSLNLNLPIIDLNYQKPPIWKVPETSKCY